MKSKKGFVIKTGNGSYLVGVFCNPNSGSSFSFVPELDGAYVWDCREDASEALLLMSDRLGGRIVEVEVRRVVVEK